MKTLSSSNQVQWHYPLRTSTRNIASETTLAADVSICGTDTLSCSLTSNGRPLSVFNVTGFDSVATLFRYVKEHLGNVRGLITLILRNSTQGWSRSYSLYLR